VVTRRIPARFGLDPIRDVQVLCPMNHDGLGAWSLNLELQRWLTVRKGASGMCRPRAKVDACLG
jgi:ATP-dependent exoDNAse (exonuclease V) alpha subunit